MPTYEYECEATGRRFECFQKMSEKPLRTCPECGGPARRLIGAGGAVIFKGSGFYATDYGRGSRPTTRCGGSQTCCGRDTPCDQPPCDS
ncbi:MAG: FmdB family zinc ribbon protein [Planctomycetota bacterium]